METQGYRHEWMNYLEKAIEQATLSADRTALARLQLQLAILHQLMGDYAAADEYLVQCRQVAEAVGDRALLVLALNRLSASAAEQHQLSKARALVDEILALLDPDDLACAHAYGILGVIAVRHGKWDEARTHYRRVLDLREREGNPHLIAKAYANYMLILNVREDEALPGVKDRRTIDDPDGNAKEYSKVLSYYQDAIQLYHEAGNLYDEAVAMMNCGLVSWHLGHYDDALNYYAASERLFLRINNRLNLIIVYIDRGCALCEMGRYAEAEQNLTYSIQLARELGDPFRTYYGLVGLGDLYLRTHRYDERDWHLE